MSADPRAASAQVDAPGLGLDIDLTVASQIDGARRVVAEAERFGIADPLAHQYRLGLVLGRAVAHEIGHYLLATGTHSVRGLMRAGFDAGEFADVRAAGTFVLDDDASRWVRERVLASGVHTPEANGCLAVPPALLPVRGFPTVAPRRRHKAAGATTGPPLGRINPRSHS